MLKTDVNSNMCYFNISAFDLDSLLNENKDMISQSFPILEQMSSFLNDSSSIMLVNKDGYILNVNSLNSDLKLPIGGRFSEKFNGNTSMSTAVIENKPVCLVGEDHYCRIYHKYATLSAPIFIDDEIVGLVSVIMPCENVNKHTLGLIATAAKTVSYAVKAVRATRELVAKNKWESVIVETITEASSLWTRMVL
jgi:transcriptional regulator of acetoin/glycerol metabolism